PVVHFWNCHRSAEGSAELILPQRRFLESGLPGIQKVVLKIILGVQLIVLQELIRRTMDVVGPRPHHHDELGARLEPILSRVTPSEYATFLQSRRSRRVRYGIHASLSRGDPVERRVLIRFPLSVRNQRDGLAGDWDSATGSGLSIEAAARR